jgi:hypothetical protein
MGWTNDSDALDLYLQARYLFNSRKPENLWKSVPLDDRALKKEPKFARLSPAWRKITWCWPPMKIGIFPK